MIRKIIHRSKNNNNDNNKNNNHSNNTNNNNNDNKKLDDGWPEGEEEHVTLVLLQRECKEHKKI